MTERPDWMKGLSHKDWLLDGHAINGAHAIERFNRLDWSRAYVDMGPSPTGNPGPYWKVPLPDEETVHRLYPRVLLTKWLLLIRQACEEVAQSTTQEKT